MLSSACQQLCLLSLFVTSYHLSKQENTNTSIVLNRKRENKEAKYIIVFQLMKIIAEIKIHVKINIKAISIFLMIYQGTRRRRICALSEITECIENA